MINIENILYPFEALRENKDELVDVYIEDYGEEYEKYIKRKMNKTVYVFESTPDVTFEFLKKNSNKIYDEKLRRRIEKEYEDYIIEKERIEKKLAKSLNYKVSLITGDESFPGKGFFELDFESFSTNNDLKLRNPKVRKMTKLAILKRRKNYIRICRALNIKPILNSAAVDYLQTYKNDLLNKRNEYLIKNTLWGKRVFKETNLQLKGYVSTESLANLFYIDNPGITRFNRASKNSKMKGLCYVPLIKNIDEGEIDKIFFHENRHVIEYTDKTCGISKYSSDKYNILNEIHTQKNAIEDNNKLNTIFGKTDEQQLISVYDLLFPYTGTFFEDNKKIINECSINGDIKLLEDYFGKENIEEFDRYINSLYKEISSDVARKNLSTNKEKQRSLIRSMNSNYR